jgi:hypothetical protein
MSCAVDAVAGMTIARISATKPSTTRVFCMKALLQGVHPGSHEASGPLGDARPLVSGAEAT